MKHPVKKTIALLIAACFLLGNVVFADPKNVSILEVDSNAPVGVSVDVQGLQDDGTPGNTTVSGNGELLFDSSNVSIDHMNVDVESITNKCDLASYYDNQSGDEGRVSTGLYVSNTGYYQVCVNVAEGVTNTGIDLDETFGVQTRNDYDGVTDIQIQGDVNAIAIGGTNMVTGIDAEVNEGSLSISANNVTVEGEAEATGVNLNPGFDYESCYCGAVKANLNDISVSSKGNVTGVNVQLTGGDAIVTTGKITVETTKKTTEEDALEDQSSAGVRIDLTDVSIGSPYSSANVTTKDIIATGENTVGIEIIGMIPPENEESLLNYVDIVSDGTVSGDEVAVRVHSAEKEDTGYINLTLWSAKENENGQIVNVNGSLEPEAKKAAAEIEARINYIIKLADGWKDNISITTANGNTVVIDGQTYNTAKENETVTIKVNLPVLDGIFYTDGVDNTYTAVNNLTRNADGSYSIKMLRGGSMMLGLKTHTHNSLERQENTGTGYDIVTYCTICGAELDRVHYNHSPSAQAPAVPDASISTEVSLAPAASENRTKSIDPTLTKIAPERFVAVDQNTVVHGVKAADRLPIEDAFAILGEHLDDEQAVVKIENMDQLLNAKELTQFESLGASDCLMVLLAVLGNSDFLEVELYDMSQGAKALAEEITTRISNMTNDAKAEFNKQIRTIFGLKKVFVDNHEYDSISIELTITNNGKETKERYSFANKDNVWVLYRIEQLKK